MIILDTNVVSGLMHTPVDEPLRRWLSLRAGEALAVTAVSVAEIEYGIHRLSPGRRRTSLAQKFDAVIDPAGPITLLPLEEAAARRAGAFLAAREAQGRPTSDADMMIAGIAAVRGAPVATGNVRDFEGLGLTIHDPWAP